uniref:Uncharacterized protein n=1 Tax=Rhizophora mucronata TaxID=61149 RepID=A0A2P2NXK1_RHIMU
MVFFSFLFLYSYQGYNK